MYPINPARERRGGESIVFEGNVHRQTERHLQLVTGRGTATAHILAIAQDVIARTAWNFAKSGRTHPRLDAIATD
jgi:hypothetical protein